MRPHHAIALAALLAASPALSQDAEDVRAGETVEELASEEEMAAVRESIGRIGCDAAVIEKESDDLFEVDDATCEIGQYDFKLDGDYRIIIMTFDE